MSFLLRFHLERYLRAACASAWLLSLSLGLTLAWFPCGAAALGEYDGVWMGRESATADGQTVSAISGTIVYQSSANTLHLFTGIDARSLSLQRSGGVWVLPSPVNTTLLGYYLRLETFELRFQGLDRSIASYTGTVQGSRFTGNADYRRHPCRGIVAPYDSGLLAGAEDSLTCFEVVVPVGALALRATTSGGSGDADLIAVYHKPSFPYLISDGPDNAESVLLTSPEPGKWFVGVIGWEDFAGVRLSITMDLPPPAPSFSASPSAGIVPLTVQFLDASSGVVNEWFWEFGDGGTSTLRNPQHVYATPGRYDVRLSVTGPGGDESLTKPGAIRASGSASVVPILDLLLKDAPQPP